MIRAKFKIYVSDLHISINLDYKVLTSTTTKLCDAYLSDIHELNGHETGKISVCILFK